MSRALARLTEWHPAIWAVLPLWFPLLPLLLVAVLIAEMNRDEEAL